LNALPKRMIDRWECRTDLEPGQGQLYWHIFVGGHPQVRALVSMAQRRLATFSGLHFTPLRWLHITTFTPGAAIRLTPPEIEDLAAHVRQLASNIPAITISLGRILYHSEAIALDVGPAGALDPVLDVVRQGTEAFVGVNGNLRGSRWAPHVTLAYSTVDQPAGPIISALGSELPPCEVVVNSVSLVLQEGPERLWNWRTLAEAEFTRSGK
jgi:2'-5' RNA ligase